MKLDRGSLIVAATLALLASGCGGSSSTSAGAGAIQPKATPPPRPGEDVMKEQYQKLLQKKGRLPKGITLPKK